MTGRTPLLDSLRAANIQGAIYYDWRSGSFRNLYGDWGHISTVNANHRLQRNGFLIQSPTAQTTTSESFVYPDMSQLTVLSRHACLSSPAVYQSTINVGKSSAPRSDLNLGIGYPGNLLFRANIFANGTAVAIGQATSTDNKIQSWATRWKKNDAVGFKQYRNGVPIGTTASTLAQADDMIYTGENANFRIASASSGTPTAALLQYLFFIPNYYLSDADIATLTDELDNQIKYESNNLIINSTYPTIGSSVWEARYGLLAGEVTMRAGQSIGQLDPLKVSTGTHKATTILYNGKLAKAIQCVTAGNIILPNPRPTLGTTWGYMYYTAATLTWAAATSATATVTLAAAGDRILWATQDGQNCLRKY